MAAIDLKRVVGLRPQSAKSILSMLYKIKGNSVSAAEETADGVNALTERVFRSLKTELIPTNGYTTGQQAQRDISQYLIHHYNWIRPHLFNDGLVPAKTEEKLYTVSGIS